MIILQRRGSAGCLNLAITLLLWVIIFAVQDRSFLVDAAWRTPTVSTGVSHPIAENLFALGDPFTITFQHTSDIRFSAELANDKSVFPGSCSSDKAQTNLYGWDRWKNELFGGITVVDFRQIQMTIVPTGGYSVTEDETISCGPFVNRETGSQYFYNGDLDPKDFLTFAIRRRTEVTTQLCADSSCKTVLTDIHERDIRNDGLKIFITLVNDVWRTSQKEQIRTGLKCHLDDCFSRILDASMFSISEDRPHQLVLEVPRGTARNFNIAELHTITFVVANAGSGLGVKGIPIETPQASNKINVNAAPSSPSITVETVEYLTPARTVTLSTPKALPDHSLRVSERCIRGKEMDDLVGCPMTLVFKTPSLVPQYHQFTRNEHTEPDIAKYAFSSSQEFDFSTYGSDFLYYVQASDDVGSGAPPNVKLVMYMFFKAFHQYDIVANDTISVHLPYTSFNSSEPPVANPFPTIHVHPSEGDIVGDLRDVSEKDLWSAGVTMRLILDNEGWDPSVLTSSLIANASSGSLANGWNAHKRCLLNNSVAGAFSFEPLANGNGVNCSVVVIRFPGCAEFNIEEDEVVSFTDFPLSGITLSGLDIRRHDTASLSFTITARAEGELTVVAQDGYDETGMWSSPGIFFDLTLAGDTWLDPIPAECVTAFGDTWTTNVPFVANLDNSSWSSPTVRDAMLRGGTAVQRLSTSTVRVTFSNLRDVYKTRRGEEILVKVPNVCTLSPFAPEGNATIRILPHNGVVGFKFEEVAGTTTSMWPDDIRGDVTHDISEALLRGGNLAIFVALRGDTFQAATAVEQEMLRREVYEGLVASDFEAGGWNASRPFMVASAADIVIVDDQLIKIPIQSFARYDIKANETISLRVQGHWFSSGRRPENDVLRINAHTAPGAVQLLSWYGETTTNSITEHDVRAGRLWFELGLVGDEWRRNRNAFVASFTSNDTTPHSLRNLIMHLVPEMDFFNFTTGDDFQHNRFGLQSSNDYDIHTNEEVTLRLSQRATLSQLPPVFVSNNVAVHSFTFVVKAARGRAVLSGMTQNVDEKTIRQKQVILFLTLIGEQWSADAPDLILRAFKSLSPKEQEKSGFENLKLLSLVPLEQIVVTTANQLTITMRRTPGYNIHNPETLTLDIVPEAVKSGIKPEFAPMVITVGTTGGELVLNSSTVIYETDLRTRNVDVSFNLQGDVWMRGGVMEFVGSFSSQSSLLSERHGFLAYSKSILHMDTSGDVIQRPRVDFRGTEAIVTLFKEERYDISQDEVVTFTVTNPNFVGTGVLPDPQSVSFVIRAVPRPITLIIDDKLQGSQKDGRYDLERLQELIAEMLSTSPSRVSVALNADPLRDDGYLVVDLLFVGEPTETEVRLNYELAEIFLGLDNAFTYGYLGVQWAYYADAPPPSWQIHGTSTTPAPMARAERMETWAVILVVLGGILFIALAIAGYVIGMNIRLGTRGGSSRLGNAQRIKKPIPLEGATEPDVEFAAIGGGSPHGDNDVGNVETAAVGARRNAQLGSSSGEGRRSLQVAQPMPLRSYVKRQMGIPEFSPQDEADAADEVSGHNSSSNRLGDYSPPRAGRSSNSLGSVYSTSLARRSNSGSPPQGPGAEPESPEQVRQRKHFHRVVDHLMDF